MTIKHATNLANAVRLLRDQPECTPALMDDLLMKKAGAWKEVTEQVKILLNARSK
jgi:hypothetical protein